MKADLVFWDSKTQSKNGTIRGLLAIVILVPIMFIWYGYIFTGYSKYINVVNKTRSFIALFLFVVLLASAIAVVQPKVGLASIFYGILVGLVIFGCINLVYLAIQPYPVSMAVVDTLFGMFLSGVVSYILYLVFWKTEKHVITE